MTINNTTTRSTVAPRKKWTACSPVRLLSRSPAALRLSLLLTSAEIGPDPGDQRTITVTGERIHSSVRSTGTGTKTDTPIGETVPQSATVLSLGADRRPGSCSLSDLAELRSGASTIPRRRPSRRWCFAATTSTADFFVDGVRDDAQYLRDLYNVERVEALKGPNAMIFGRGGGGGVINRVRKKHTLRSPLEQRSTSGDGWWRYTLHAGRGTPLPRLVEVRLDGMYEDADSFEIMST